jgi:FkbM family methyltransferase
MRALGVPRLLALLGTPYESAFSKRLVSACRPGDVIWDVGANVGHYSISFADWTGPQGRVFAFEPSAVNLNRLRAACEGKLNIKIRDFGLSDKAGQAAFLEGSDSLNTTSRVLSPNDVIERQTTQVELRTGAEIIDSGDAERPNMLKIDVEGHELSVLKGLSAVLSDPQLHDIFVEVHFGILDGSGRSEDPKLIEELLKRNGFKLNWTDASHLHAYRAV